MSKYIAIIKGKHNYILRYEGGDEPQLLKRVLDYAKDPTSNLDWQDVVYFIRRIREVLLEEIKSKT